ncbi:hypothetical protein JNUCC24_13005 [Bacillus sp. JNUCC-24]|nr:hypothetical protein [Bacillus sp. JNUCC-24]QWS49421.1 hypothetical protein JNUCC24_13005 [Bacillus sp. JNUCC-24]
MESMYYLDPRQYFLPEAFIKQQFTLGRTGHYYQTKLASYNRIMTIQLLSIDGTGMVSMNVYEPRTRQWVFHQEHNTDMFGLTYLGPVLPSHHHRTDYQYY